MKFLRSFSFASKFSLFLVMPEGIYINYRGYNIMYPVKVPSKRLNLNYLIAPENADPCVILASHGGRGYSRVKNSVT